MITGSESDEDITGPTKDPTPTQNTPSQDAPVDDFVSSEAKAAPTSFPAQNLRLEEARTQAAKAASQKWADEGAVVAAKKRAAPDSPSREYGFSKGYHSLFDTSSDEAVEEGAISELQGISHDLDKQQEHYQAAQLQGASEVSSSAPPAPVYPRRYCPPDEGSGSPMFLEHLKAPRGLNLGRTSRGAYERALAQAEPLFANDIEAARCVLLASYRMSLKEFTSLRRKPEDRGGLFPHHIPIPDRRPVPEMALLKNFAIQELKELRQDRLLSYVLDQRDLRIELPT
ncbi:LOW QUALITY PROTEIN: Hypothetical protein PHPALM_6031 [Phytophthora palmivora]|uniref:ATP-binding cassette (ABC) Superfamily n=1 Tax=Phytophthora palmivora TaxID=4796 RepID=A0A2P4YFV7_9STRA|nr:LOW QUALITY PROTEIN: Hypothetical protein PHPALM_6031 [Phytophthora palmivora]